jgi:hypothetical protein
MSLAQTELVSNHLNESQIETITKFKNSLAKKLPDFRIVWVKPVKENMIELHLESEKRTYRRGLLAVKLAVEVEDETGVIIILR